MKVNVNTVLTVGFAVCVMAGAASGDWLSLGPDGGRFDAATIDPHDPNTIYVAPYLSGQSSVLHKSTDQGRSWQDVGTITGCYAPYRLMIDPNHDSLFYAVASGNGFFRSTNHGATWSRVVLPQYVYYGALDPLVSGRLYVVGYGSSSPRNVYVSRSDDFGATWSAAVRVDSTGENQYGYAIAVDPVDSGVVYVGSNYGGVYRSTDAGATWTKKNAGITGNTYVRRLYVDPVDPGIVIAAASGGIFRTTNAGDTWVRTGSVMAYYLAFSPVNPDIGFAGYNSVYRTTNRGLTWSRPTPGLKQRYFKGFQCHPESAGVVYNWGSSGLYRTADQGVNWSPAHTGLRSSNVFSVAVSPNDGNRVYVDLDDCGTFRSTDGGATWDTCGYFSSCGNICEIGIPVGPGPDVLYALEGGG